MFDNGAPGAVDGLPVDVDPGAGQRAVRLLRRVVTDQRTIRWLLVDLQAGEIWQAVPETDGGVHDWERLP